MLRKRWLSLDTMVSLEEQIEHGSLMVLRDTQSEQLTAAQFGLQVVYTDDALMPHDVEAELRPSDSEQFLGQIRIRRSLKDVPFSFIHELVHYVCDIGIGNKVTCTLTRKVRGAVKDEHEQRIDYCSAAIQMPYAQVRQDVERYDSASPRMNPVTFVEQLCQKYKVDRQTAIRRVREVRGVSLRRKYP